MGDPSIDPESRGNLSAAPPVVQRLTVIVSADDAQGQRRQQQKQKDPYFSESETGIVDQIEVVPAESESAVMDGVDPLVVAYEGHEPDAHGQLGVPLP